MNRGGTSGSESDESRSGSESDTEVMPKEESKDDGNMRISMIKKSV